MPTDLNASDHAEVSEEYSDLTTSADKRAGRIIGSTISAIGTAGVVRGGILVASNYIPALAGAITGGIGLIAMESVMLVAGIASFIYQYRKLSKANAEAKKYQALVKAREASIETVKKAVKTQEAEVKVEIDKHATQSALLHREHHLHHVLTYIMRALRPEDQSEQAIAAAKARIAYYQKYDQSIQDALNAPLNVGLDKLEAIFKNLNSELGLGLDFSMKPASPYSEGFTLAEMPTFKYDDQMAKPTPRSQRFLVAKGVKNVLGFAIGAFFIGSAFGPVGSVVGFLVGVGLGGLSAFFNYKKEKLAHKRMATPKEKALQLGGYQSRLTSHQDLLKSQLGQAKQNTTLIASKQAETREAMKAASREIHQSNFALLAPRLSAQGKSAPTAVAKPASIGPNPRSEAPDPFASLPRNRKK